MKLEKILLLSTLAVLGSCGNDVRTFQDWKRMPKCVEYSFDKNFIDKKKDVESKSKFVDSVYSDIRVAIAYDEGYSKGLIDIKNDKRNYSLNPSINPSLLDTIYAAGFIEGYYDALTPNSDEEESDYMVDE